MPKISIITPVYADIPEKIQWLHEAIDSVLIQTFQDWEMIIIDDKSVFELEQTRYRDEPRLRWFKVGQQSGPAAARNTAVALAESEAILPLDADDKLGNENILEKLYNAWIMDTSKIIYGNLIQLVDINGTYQQGKMFPLADYTFDRAMNLNGVMPITALHSTKCWQDAGGWKLELDAGLEDVEYWLAAGKAGYCGVKINEPVLLYRQQKESRTYYLKNVDNRFAEMQQRIKSIHNDVFEGRFPMGCCGKGNSNSQPVNSVSQLSNRITTLEGYDANELVWMQYEGGKRGKFDIHVAKPVPNIAYTIMGTGHVFQVHRYHVQHLQRMRGFHVTAEPVVIKTEEPKEEIRYVGPEPQLATIERLDRIAADSMGLDLPAVNDNVEPILTPTIDYTLSDLDIGRFEQMLDHDKWTVEKLAQSTQDDLTNYPQVGPARAAAIISKAQELINAV